MKLPALKHYNYDQLEESCNCTLCVDERTAAAAYSKFLDEREQHPWICQCESCKTRNQLYENLLLASTKRDTYSELSYLMQDHPDKGPFLAWVWRATQKLDDKVKTFSRKWWLGQGLSITLGWWLKKWHMLSGVDLFDK